MSTKPRFKACLLAAAIATLPLFAESAGLGRLNVLSGLGQPFRGEIEVVAVQPNELESLKVNLADAEAYTSAQMSYPTPSLGLKLVLNKRDNGKVVVHVSSAAAIDEPVFNLLVDLTWVGGHIQREYTALIDPAGYTATPGGATITPAGTPGRFGTDVLPGKRVSSAIRSPKSSVRSNRSAKPAPSAASDVAEAPPKQHEVADANAADSYTVKSGDTLSSIAGKVKPEGVSLEQVLVSLYQSNKDAFDGNMNRIKRGKILRVPSAEDMGAVGKAEAAKEIKAQAANWHNYRHQLADSATKTPAAETSTPSSGGRIKAKVEDKGTQAAGKGQDVLKLSHGASQTDSQQARVKALEEEAAARQKALDEANQRVALLQSNIKKMEELAAVKSKLGTELQNKAQQQNQASSAGSAPLKPAIASPAASVVAPVAASPVVEASAAAASPVQASAVPAVVASPAGQASAPVKPRHRVAPPPPPPVEEPGILSILQDNALTIGGGLLVVVLGVGGILWSRSRRRPGVFENSLITSGDLKPNTVLGRTGGGVISTQAENSFLTDFSRQGLGTIDTDEVDPIAEADVYMAYGRDAQAEEILKDALVKDPGRQEIRMKLLDIYVARKNKTSFEEVAADLYAATGGKGPLWDQAVYLGRTIDPDNPLYVRSDSSAAPAAAAPAVAAVAAAGVAAATVASPVEPEASVPAHDDGGVLDFEFEMPAAEPVLPVEEAVLPVEDFETKDEDVFSFDLGLGDLPEPVAEAPAAIDLSKKEEPEQDLMALDLPIEMGNDFAPQADAGVDMPEIDLNLELGSLPADDESALEAQALADFNNELSGLDIPELDFPVSEEVAPALEEEAIHLDFGFDSTPVQAPVKLDKPAEPDMPINLDMEIGDGAGQGLDDFSDDPVQTKIDLAKAYIDMGDVEGAREILQEAEQEGNPAQRTVAHELLAGL